jgi:orotate phosphoribosyltransferase
LACPSETILDPKGIDMHEVEKALRDHGCVYTDDTNNPPDKRVHLVLASGKHSDGYVNVDPITPHPKLVEVFASELFGLLPTAPESQLLYEEKLALIGPEKGVNAFLYSLSNCLYKWRDSHLYMKGEPQTFSIVVEKRKVENGTEYYVDRDGHASLCDGAYLIGVEDVTTTGGSLGGALQVGIDNGGIPAAGVSVWNRGSVTAEDLGLPSGSFQSIIKHELPMWYKDECPLCAEHVPIALDLGRGKLFQTENPNYPGGFTTLLS